MDFELIGRIENAETIATGHSIRQLERLRRRYGRWLKKKGLAKVRLGDGTIARAEIHWYEAHGTRKAGYERKTPAGWTMKRNRSGKQLVVCVWNKGNEASLETMKIYERLMDSEGETHGLIRVIDEDAEDYLYPARHFVPIELSPSLEKAFDSLCELQSA